MWTMLAVPNTRVYPASSDLQSAYEQLKTYVRTTPLLKSDYLSKLINGNVLIKAESLQKTGAFKFRGALYRLLNLNSKQKQRGVVAYSSGNFAAGLAAAGQLLNVPVKLVMPHDAPKAKINNAHHYHAGVILCENSTPSREEAASRMANNLAKEFNATLLHPFDDYDIIVGQASVALEIQQQLADLETRCDHVLCPVGGGSLVAGTGLAFSSPTQVWAVEAAGFAGMNLSLTQGRRCRAEGDRASSCDALLALEPGHANLDVVLKCGVRGITTDSSLVKQAIKLAFQEMNLVLEPSGAIAVAALMENPKRFHQQSVVVIASGGNVDVETFISHLRE